MKQLLLLSLLLLPTLVFAAEDCSKLGGMCRDACAQNEESESGAFEDCYEKQLCCVSSSAVADVKCCILSFETGKFGPNNCVLPHNNICSSGSGSKLSCDALAMCK